MARLFIGLIVILLGIAIVGIAFMAPSKAICSPCRSISTALSSQVIKTDCEPIEYARIGDRYPVLVVHGNAGGLDERLMITKSTIDPDFQVILYKRADLLQSSKLKELELIMLKRLSNEATLGR